jgi:hypothetical protein
VNGTTGSSNPNCALLGLLINVFCVLKLCNAASHLMDINFEVYLSVESLKFKLLTRGNPFRKIYLLL